MIDTHCHLQDEKFDADRDAVIWRAFEGGVEKMIVVGTDEISSRQAIALSETDERLFATIAFHPYEFRDAKGRVQKAERVAEVLESMARHPKVIGIGECGLDFHSFTEEPVSEAEKEWQKKGFLKQSTLAEKYALPLIVHTRPSALDSDDAYRELLPLIAGRRVPIVLHGYQGSVSVTKNFLEMPNVFFSFGCNVTYPVRKALVGGEYDIREAVRCVPVNRILTETDAPYLSPQAMRGTRNEPVNVRYAVEAIARIRGRDREETERQIRQTFDNVFRGGTMEKMQKI